MVTFSVLRTTVSALKAVTLLRLAFNLLYSIGLFGKMNGTIIQSREQGVPKI